MQHNYLFINGKPMIMIAGEVHNSASSSPAFMEHIWKKADELCLNTLALPVTWELSEPKEGVYDFHLADALIAQAREHNKKIIFLWFGSFKNAQCSYAPDWVKQDLQRFPRAEVEKGKNKVTLTAFYHMPYTSLSVFGKETMEKDAEAFAHLMKHIRSIDETEHTVIAVQVENETGLQGAVREHSDLADQKFADPVPEQLIGRLKKHPERLPERTRRIIESASDHGSWAEVFGTGAEEIFQTYYTARYTDAVAAAGKAEYDLPMSVNAWLSQGTEPGRYPSGGPVYEMLAVWKQAAPHIDLIAPDIYVRNFLEICDQYTGKDNPLFVVETATHSHLAPRLVYAAGHYHAMGFGPFAFEDMGNPFNAQAAALFGMDVSDPLLSIPQDTKTFAWYAHTLVSMIPLLAEGYDHPENLQAVIGERPEENAMDFGTMRIHAYTKIDGMPDHPDGCALALRTAENDFYLIAGGCFLNFVSTDPAKPNVDLLEVEEGSFEKGTWIAGRRLNGDETASLLFEEPVLLHVRLMQYA